MMNMLPRCRVRIPEGILIRTVGEESVILNLSTEHYFGLDEVGTDIWQALVSTSDVSQALDQLLQRYEVDRDLLFRDVESLISKLAGHGLLIIDDTSE